MKELMNKHTREQKNANTHAQVKAKLKTWNWLHARKLKKTPTFPVWIKEWAVVPAPKIETT